MRYGTINPSAVACFLCSIVANDHAFEETAFVPQGNATIMGFLEGWKKAKNFTQSVCRPMAGP